LETSVTSHLGFILTPCGRAAILLMLGLPAAHAPKQLNIKYGFGTVNLKAQQHPGWLGS
jgi:hypothetical protein